MADRVIKDSAGRSWTCAAAPTGESGSGLGKGGDMMLTCGTPSVSAPVQLTVGWQWEKMSDNGLGRLIMEASPVPKKN